MHLVCTGDRWAFEHLYERYFDKLTWFAHGFLNDVQKAEDTVQEVFIHIIERPELFDSGKRFSTWIYTITRNACLNTVRNESNRQRLLGQNVRPLQATHSEMHHESDLRLLQECLDKAYKGLNDKEKSIYTLRFEEELSIKEIAEIHNIPEGSVKSGIYYMLKKLSGHLKEFNHGKTV